MRVGLQARVGIDAVVAGRLLDMRLNQTISLGQETALGENRQAGSAHKAG
jgi:hypothetical protein